MFPLVRELAADRIPVAVTCRVLGFSKQALFRWRKNSVSQRDWDNANLTNAAVDLHRDDPPFGYRSSPTRSKRKPGWQRRNGACGDCVQSSGSGACSRRDAACTGKRGLPCMTISCSVTSPGPGRTSCGWLTSPSIGLMKGSCISTRSRRALESDRRLLARLSNDRAARRRRTAQRRCAPRPGRDDAALGSRVTWIERTYHRRRRQRRLGRLTPIEFEIINTPAAHAS